MDVPTITIDKETARKKLKAYRERLHKDSEDQYRAAAAGYQHLAEGRALIDLAEVFRHVELHEDQSPRLAVARADRREVKFTWRPYGTHVSFDSQLSTGPHSPSMHAEVDLGREHGVVAPAGYARTLSGYSLVPLVPADVRPETGKLRDWHILWEVEHWSMRPQSAVPDRDPLLLKHVGGTLYAILAAWDLTDLERAIMRGAMR